MSKTSFSKQGCGIMLLQEAVDLIHSERINQFHNHTWADLGCGSGMFTQALSHFLSKGSIIHAVDIADLSRLPEQYGEVLIKKFKKDFIKEELPFHQLDGILMANSLHYVKDKPAFLGKANHCLKQTGCYLIVEYETTVSNSWVPYPIPFAQMKELFSKAGFTSITKLNERPSIYNQAMMYSALIER